MNNLTKGIVCLYASVALVTAENVEFDGNEDHGVIQFATETSDNGSITIKKVSIDRNSLEPGKVKKVNLIIPSKVQDKQVNIGKQALMNLSSNCCQLNIQFKMVEDDLNPVCVQLPEDCCRMFFNSKSITGIDFSGADLSQVKNAIRMFQECTNLQNINFKGSPLPK